MLYYSQSAALLWQVPNEPCVTYAKLSRTTTKRVLSQYTTEELIYLKKQLALTDELRKLDVEERRRTKGFSN